MSETLRSDELGAIRQGDILALEGFGGLLTAPQFGVVINADCDLAWGRTDGVIAILPVYTFQAYLEAFWLPEHLEMEAKRSVRSALALCGRPEDEDADLLRWLEASAHSEVAAALIETCVVPVRKQPEIHAWCRRASIVLSQRGMSAFQQICNLERDPHSYAKKHLEAAKRAIGDGHFFISEIAGQSGIGYVVRMRRILSLPADSCFESHAKMLARTGAGGQLGGRVARLTATYQYRVAQMFAYQYSRIGLSDETTSLSSLAVEDIIAGLGINK